jgi:uncharacterized protein (DUF2126 family)/transglutaminase-like putative cysteine protease
MTLNVALTHRTSYHYDRPVGLGPQTIRLRPAPHARTPILSYSLGIAPEPHFLNWVQDPQGNFLARVVFPERVTKFEVTVDLIADMATINPFDFFLEPDAESWPFAYDPALEQELAPYRKLNPVGPRLQALLDAVPHGKQRTIDMLVGLNQDIQRRVGYIVRMEPGVWDPEQTLAEARGSCRDSAWLLVNLLRNLGYAARFCSGYLIQLVGDVKPVSGPEGPTADFTDLHAWAEVYLPGAGWIGLDATSGLLTGEGHIPLASSPDPVSAAPISGTVEKAETTFDVSMTLRRVRETPRTTKPYSRETWQAILAAGDRVERALEAGKVRLTMGGEPTFVSATDMNGAEWNTDALGPDKRKLAGRLMRRLLPLWAHGAALHHGLGKHYPGEQLPRWAMTAYWRADGEAVWQDPSLLASDDDRDTATAADAASFAAILAGKLAVDPALVVPAYEDIHYYLWREHRLPANVVVEDAKLADKLERARLARVFGQGLNAPVGAVLPLRRAVLGGVPAWESGKWFFRGEHLFLIPGDSPIGLRLPLESLPWVDPKNPEVDAIFEPDPFRPVSPFPPAQALRPARQVVAGRQPMAPRAPGAGPARGFAPFAPSGQDAPGVGEEAPGVVRTALCVESRGGLLHVFLPPLYDAEAWVELVAAIEETAAETRRKIFLEGYTPPEDERLLQFSITPDPGVIEVNVHPVRSWREQVERTEQLYEEARQVGLATEKFMLDGRHVGTGGGNHVVMGAASAADSPFLRRPDLLRSMVGFWHNHPSLSYLFSGLFIGPSSQHPRVDEARMDSINELETAFRQISPFTVTPPWMTDRIFRNLLVDMTGNTHRAEFCIDKLYSPDSAGGRRGLVEFRAFEMPPHPEMSLAQSLLTRAAIAAFWQHPYDRKLVRWGTRLHDQFMMRSYVERDFADALGELAQFGQPLEPDWFEPHFAFRFPVLGNVSVHGVDLTLRHALEPWHVLGEETAAGGTARYVDSSVERVEAVVEGWVAERFVLACNGSAVPLRATERAGEFVGGVRFKAWNPPSALHPTIQAHSPLIFDIYDKWTGRSLGGLTHHVVHPGGRSYETFPVNANEAEARRRSRFFPFGHTPGSTPEPGGMSGLELPFTLDLRMQS